MGYRSQVSALIYGPTEKMAGLIMKERHSTAKHTLFNSDFAPHLTEWDAPEGDQHAGMSFLLLEGEDWKWYEGYEDVGAWETFMRSAPEYGCAYEFARIGEETTDIDVTNGEPDGEGSQTVLWLLNVGSQINCEVGPPYNPETDTTVSEPLTPAPVYWGASEVEAAMCLWEAFLEFDGQDEPLVKKLREEDGTPAARHVVMGWAHECEKAWDEARANGTETEPFDWEHCPNFLMRKLTQRFVGQGER